MNIFCKNFFGVIMDIVIIGGGLGGLLSGAILSNKGHNITIYEKLPFVGGRFTNIPYKGYQLTTGALHMVPHGADGFLGKCLKLANCNVKIVKSNPDGLFMVDGKIYSYKELFNLVGVGDKLKGLKMALNLKLGRVDKSLSFGEFLEDMPLALKIGNSFTGWALSLDAHHTPIDEIVEITKYYHKFGGPGIPIGGCKGIIDSLVRVILSNGGKIITNYKIDRVDIDFSEKKVYVNVDNNENGEFDGVIFNISPKDVEKISNVKIDKKGIPSKGIKVSIGSKKPLIDFNGVLFTTDCERVNGLNCPSNVDRSLSKEGYHLTMVHGAQIGNNVKKEIDIVLEDIEYLFNLKGIDYDILHIQSYRDDIPVNHSSNGTDIDPIIYDNVFIVGDGAKGKGGIEVEGISMGVLKVVDYINNNYQ